MSQFVIYDPIIYDTTKSVAGVGLVGTPKLEMDGAGVGTDDVARRRTVGTQPTLCPAAALQVDELPMATLRPIQLHGRRTVGGDMGRGGGPRRRMEFGWRLGIGVSGVGGGRLIQLHCNGGCDVVPKDERHPTLSSELKKHPLLKLVKEGIDKGVITPMGVESVGDDLEIDGQLSHCGCLPQSSEGALLSGRGHPCTEELYQLAKEDGESVLRREEIRGGVHLRLVPLASWTCEEGLGTDDLVSLRYIDVGTGHDELHDSNRLASQLHRKSTREGRRGRKV